MKNDTPEITSAQPRRCPQCGLWIAGPYRSAGGHLWHPKCLVSARSEVNTQGAPDGV
jgi:hypothetical protein